jgi:hypothetical protein
VLEGAGRTLKGRDLRRVRNAVLRRTGFLDWGGGESSVRHVAFAIKFWPCFCPQFAILFPDDVFPVRLFWFHPLVRTKGVGKVEVSWVSKDVIMMLFHQAYMKILALIFHQSVCAVRWEDAISCLFS